MLNNILLYIKLSALDTMWLYKSLCHQVVEQEAVCNWCHVAGQQAVLDTCD